MKIQASSISRILDCPYSLQLEQIIPEGMANQPIMRASSLGSDMHEIAEKQLEAFLKGEKIESIPKMVKDKTNQAEYDKGFNAVNTYVNYVKKHIRKYQKNIKYQDFTCLIEQKYKFKYGRYELVAKMDFMSHYKKDSIIYIDIFDLKTGNWDYSKSAYNQMYFTVLLFIYKEFPKEHKFNITIHTVQPNYWLEGYSIVKEEVEKYPYVSSKELLDNFLYQIHNNETCQPCEGCKFCPGLLVCPEAMRIMIRLEEYINLTKEEVSMLDMKELEEVQELSEFFKTFLKAVEEHLINNEERLTKFRVKHNKMSKKLIKIENPFGEVE